MNILLALSLIAIDPNAGTAGFDFLRITPTAREAAMAGAVTGDAQSPMAFWYSPVHVLGSEEPRAHLGYVNYVAGIRLGSAGYSRPLSPTTGVGLGVVYLNSGTMKRTDALGNEMGTFGVSFADVNLSAAAKVKNLEGHDVFSVGVGIQGLYGSIDTFFSMALAGNVGASAGIPIEGFEGLTAGVVARNVGHQLKAFQSERDAMPVELAAGLGYQPDPAFCLAFDIVKPLDNRVLFRAGVEGWIGDFLVLRAGYNSLGPDLKSGGGSDILAGVATGLGIRYESYQLDYCFIPMVELGMAHRLSLSFEL